MFLYSLVHALFNELFPLFSKFGGQGVGVLQKNLSFFFLLKSYVDPLIYYSAIL